MVTNEEVAVKMESVSAKVPQLAHEARIYKIIDNMQGYPQMRWFGTEEGYNVMVMDLLGPSLEDLFEFCSRKFTYKTVLMIADQLVTCLEYLHSKNYFHRDIKPENFLMGLGESAGFVHIIDFGLAKMYRDPKTQQHIKARQGKKDLVGTARYASIAAHNGVELSRRDDLESVGYVLLYFLRGSLPWQGLKGANVAEKYDKIGEKKRTSTIDELCAGHPAAFAQYLEYCRGLEYETDPDYDYLRGLFRQAFTQHEFFYNFVYDWTILSTKGVLSVSVVQAANLTAKDGSGSQSSDAYCLVQMGAKRERTRVIPRTLNPTWEEHFDFDVTEPAAALTVNVWHKGKFKDRFLGRIVVPISKVEHKVMMDKWVDLQKRSPKSHVSGAIRVVLYYAHTRA